VPGPSRALKKKNEALCGTGFFEHIYEYRCTNIGDISDEGASKGLNEGETDLADSLMSKLGVNIDDITNNFIDGSRKGEEDDDKNGKSEEKGK